MFNQLFVKSHKVSIWFTCLIILFESNAQLEVIRNNVLWKILKCLWKILLFLLKCYFVVILKAWSKTILLYTYLMSENNNNWRKALDEHTITFRWKVLFLKGIFSRIRCTGMYNYWQCVQFALVFLIWFLYSYYNYLPVYFVEVSPFYSL